MQYLTQLDVVFLPLDARQARAKEGARKKLAEGNVGVKHEELTMEEWDEQSRKYVAEKMRVAKGTEKEQAKARKKLERSQNRLRKEWVLRREVRRELKEEEEKKKMEEGEEGK